MGYEMRLEIREETYLFHSSLITHHTHKDEHAQQQKMGWKYEQASRHVCNTTQKQRQERNTTRMQQSNIQHFNTKKTKKQTK